MRAWNSWKAGTTGISTAFPVFIQTSTGSSQGDGKPSRRLKGTLSEERVLMSEGGAGGERASRRFKLDGEEAATTFDLGGGGGEEQ